MLGLDGRLTTKEAFGIFEDHVKGGDEHEGDGSGKEYAEAEADGHGD